MQTVFNPGRTPVTVDKGRIVPAGERAELPDGPRLRKALKAERLIVPADVDDDKVATAPSTPPPAPDETPTSPTTSSASSAGEPPAKQQKGASR